MIGSSAELAYGLAALSTSGLFVFLVYRHRRPRLYLVPSIAGSHDLRASQSGLLSGERTRDRHLKVLPHLR